jgi:hypothetical protein
VQGGEREKRGAFILLEEGVGVGQKSVEDSGMMSKKKFPENYC